MVERPEKVFRRTLRLLRQSWRAHVDRPAAVLLLLAGCIALFTLDALTGRRDPGAGDLSKLFAPTPLDAYTGVRVADGSLLRLGLLIPLRSVFVVGVLSLLLKTPPALGRMVKVVALQVAGTLTFAVLAVVGVLYFRQKSIAIESSEGWPAALGLLALGPILILVVTVVLAPLVCSASIGERMGIPLNDGAVWVLAIVSTWLWMFGYERVDAIAQAPGGTGIGYAIGFGVVLLQSVIVGAIALSAGASNQPPSSLNRSSSMGASASALR